MSAVYEVPFTTPVVTMAGNRKRRFSKLVAGLSVAAATMAGIYATAAATAAIAAASFATSETTSRARIVEFAAAVKRASAEYRASQARCGLLTLAERYLCDIDAKAEEKRAKTRARLQYEESVRPSSYSAKNNPNLARRFDTVAGATLDVAPHRLH
jgi:hypothetical protein